MRSKKIGFLLCILLVSSGLIMMLYPYISKSLALKESDDSLAAYQKAFADLSEDEIGQIYDRAAEYNVRRSNNERLEDYENMLRIEESGILGSIEIPKLHLKLNIYHTADMEILKKGIGHIPDSSLPVPGEAVHSVLSGHTGLPTMTAFDDLDQVRIGDIFYLDVLGRRYCYEVDQIKIVLPEECSDYLFLEDGKTYVTLLTCTPYGVNTHRLLVRGCYIGEESVESFLSEGQVNTGCFYLSCLFIGGISCLIVIKRVGKRAKRK